MRIVCVLLALALIVFLSCAKLPCLGCRSSSVKKQPASKGQAKAIPKVQPISVGSLLRKKSNNRESTQQQVKPQAQPQQQQYNPPQKTYNSRLDEDSYSNKFMSYPQHQPQQQAQQSNPQSSYIDEDHPSYKFMRASGSSGQQSQPQQPQQQASSMGIDEDDPRYRMANRY
jgi:hypothetical protein